eukprot:5252208-Pleurochrysis_carterae.AAC.2
MATVVNFLTAAPSAHCANVIVAARALRIASHTAGNTHRGACAENRGHHAGLPGSPQSAGLSTAHTAPAASAAVTRRAVKCASALCFV